MVDNPFSNSSCSGRARLHEILILWWRHLPLLGLLEVDWWRLLCSMSFARKLSLNLSFQASACRPHARDGGSWVWHSPGMYSSVSIASCCSHIIRKYFKELQVISPESCVLLGRIPESGQRTTLLSSLRLPPPTQRVSSWECKHVHGREVFSLKWFTDWASHSEIDAHRKACTAWREKSTATRETSWVTSDRIETQLLKKPGEEWAPQKETSSLWWARRRKNMEGPLWKKEETKLSVTWRRMIAEVNSILSCSLHLCNNLQTVVELRC